MNREELFDKHLRGELSAEEAAALKHLLANDAAAGRAFVEHVNEATLLVRVGSQLESAPEKNVVSFPASPTPDFAVGSKRSVRRWQLAALAACLIALVSVAVFMNRPAPGGSTVAVKPPSRPAVYVTGTDAQIIRTGSAVIMGGLMELQAGDVVVASEKEIATIVYEQEATRVELQPGAQLLFGDAMEGKRFDLQRGIVQVRAAPQPAGKPLRVKTAHARATVLGTEFLMRTDEAGTRLDVLEGKVQLNCRTTGKKMVIKAGFGATVQAEAPAFEVTPLCSSNCILRECRGTNAASKFQKLKTSDEK